MKVLGESLARLSFKTSKDNPRKGALPPSAGVGPDDQISVSLICPCLYRPLWPPVLERLSQLQPGKVSPPREQSPYLLLRVHHSQLHLLQVGGGEGHVVVNNARHQRGRRLALCRNNKRKLLSVRVGVEGGGRGPVATHWSTVLLCSVQHTVLKCLPTRCHLKKKSETCLFQKKWKAWSHGPSSSRFLQAGHLCFATAPLTTGHSFAHSDHLPGPRRHWVSNSGQSRLLLVNTCLCPSHSSLSPTVPPTPHPHQHPLGPDGSQI